MNAIDLTFKPDGILAPGVYFGLPETTYHADKSLGSGSVRELASHPIHYWVNSWMNPLREREDDTPALLFGRALHKFTLEGRAAFEKTFAPEPSKDEHPGALDTMVEIRAALKALGQKLSGTKGELIARLRAADETAVLWEDIVSRFGVECMKLGITPLKRRMYLEVVQAASFIAGEERVRPAFQGGRSELSVFAEIDGVPCKCRLDYVRLGKEGNRTVALITDLKSYANRNGLAPERAVVSAIATYRLDTQAALYLELAGRIPELIGDGRLYGAQGVNPDFLAAITKLEPTDWRWFWCFYEKGAPITMLRDPDKDVLDMGRSELTRALQHYREHMERFGTNWRFVDPMPDTRVTLADLPKWVGH